MMGEKFNIFCLNTRGLGDKRKRKAVLSWLQEKCSGITLLQETHSALTTENDWRENWKGIIEFSHGSTNAKGVAVLLSSGLDIEISNVKKDTDGRFLLLDCIISEHSYVIINVYAPTVDKRNDQVTFGNFILDMLQDYSGRNIILGGDFNLDFDMTNNSHKSCKNPGYLRQLLYIFDTFDLVDI